jgi:O-acetylhomoserine/O-acetylserine sulfhydrylase-like pyridoxal-dependent enzyme
MIMQWFVNEVRAKFAEIDKKIQSFLDKPVVNDNDERITKLEGEIKALKARMGKAAKQE